MRKGVGMWTTAAYDSIQWYQLYTSSVSIFIINISYHNSARPEPWSNLHPGTTKLPLKSTTVNIMKDTMILVTHHDISDTINQRVAFFGIDLERH